MEVEGPAGGYKVLLADGVELRIRYLKSQGTLQTQYRISARWNLPSPSAAAMIGVRRVVQFLEARPHFSIPIEPEARELLLGAQLEQSLMASVSASVSFS